VCHLLKLVGTYQLRARKRHERSSKQSIPQEDLEDDEREKKANMLFENLFGK